MSHQIDDRWFWLGVGISLIVAFKGIKYAIEDTVCLTQVKPLGKDQDEELQRQPEDCKALPRSIYLFNYKLILASNPRRRPPHPRRLPQPQHQQMRHRHRPGPLREKPQPHRRSASRRKIFQHRPAPQSPPRHAIARQLESRWR